MEAASKPRPTARLKGELKFLTPEITVSAAERARILHQRAVLLAQEIEPEGEYIEEIDIVTFSVGNHELGVECLYSRESHLVRDLTPLACAPPYVLGIINVRGEIVAVVDLRRILHLSTTNSSVDRILVVESELGPVAFQIDGLAGVRRVPADLQSDCSKIGTKAAIFLKGVTADGIGVLDVASIAARTSLARDTELVDEVEMTQ